VQSASYLGGLTRLNLHADGQKLVALVPSNGSVPVKGATIRIAWTPDDLHLMEDER
jgi:hypothetical protein